LRACAAFAKAAQAELETDACAEAEIGNAS
jgi:hypothetical protein